MCTVTFLPDDDRSGFLLAHNRDEEFSRAPERPPRARVLGERRVLAPEDGDAGGTWIGLDDRGRALCILNGTREVRTLPLENPVSRGRLVLELLRDARAEAVGARLRERRARGDLPFQPFRLMAVTALGGTRFDWDGRELRETSFRDAWIEVSHGVAQDVAEERRRRLFERTYETMAVAERPDRREGLLSFHRGHAEEAPAGDAYSVCLHAPRARTVSCTLLDVRPEKHVMHYVAGQPCAGARPEIHEV